MANYIFEILTNNDNLSEWDNFVLQSPQGCIFCQSWWLKIVCKDGFRIFIIRQNEKIIGGLPLQNEYSSSKRVNNMPLLTQMTGILFFPNIEKINYNKYLSKNIDIMNLLIENIDDYESFYMQFHYNFTNWLPFFWKGYQQTTRYTYIIHKTNNIDDILNRFSRRKIRDIKKANKIVNIKTDINCGDFYSHHCNSLIKDNKKIRYSYDRFSRIYNGVYENNAGKSWYAVDNNGHIHSIIFVIYDNISAYYLVSSIDPDYKSLGSTSLLIWEAMKYIYSFVNIWNFEGSMKHNIEMSFRQFGGVQTPYFLITRNK